VLKLNLICRELICLFNACCIFLKVLVHGSAEATEHLKQRCLKHVCPHVYAPQIDEMIDVTSDLCACKVNKLAIYIVLSTLESSALLFFSSFLPQVQLSEKLMRNVLFKKVSLFHF
jgi:hypothetical protein